MIRKKIILLTIGFLPALLWAQPKDIDSLKNVLIKFRTSATYQSDTNYIITLNNLAFKLNQINPDTTILLSQQSVLLSDKINFIRGKVDALKNSGLAYNLKGEYNRCLLLFSEALGLAKKAGLQKTTGSVYYATGIVYSNLGKYPEALENYFKALTIRERIGDTLGIASCTNAIGAVYFVQGKYADALANYQKALQLSEQIQYTAGIESAFANIGEVNYRRGNFEAATENLSKALKINERSGNKENRAFIYYLTGSIQIKQGNYKEAMESFIKTKQLANEIGSSEYTSRSYLGLSQVYLAQKNYNYALQQAKEGISIAQKMEHGELQKDGYEILSKIYEASGDGMKALYYHKQFKLFADSINNQQTEQRAQNLAADYEYAKKEIVLKAEQEKKEIEFQKKTNQQRWIIFSAFAALFSSMVIAWIIYRSRQKGKKANRLLQKQKDEINQQRNELTKTLDHLKATQSQLIHSEKMASLGELTAGIAHEIQNPLNFVNNFSEVNKELIGEMREEIKNANYKEVSVLAKSIEDNEEKINHHGKRADAIVKGMLLHSRSQSTTKEDADINALVEEYLRLAYHGQRAKDNSFNATLKTSFDDSVGTIKVIPQDIGRVILNLITNAFHAVTEKKKQQSETFDPIIEVGSQKREGKIIVTIKDNGIGIPQKVIDKIFQPFFTTKPTGQGTGLGLSLSYDIIKAHGGQLSVETEEGKGSVFSIELPIS